MKKMFILLALLTLCSCGAKAETADEYINKTVAENDRVSESEYKKLCEAVSYSDFSNTQNALKGQKMTFTGEVIQVKDDICRMNVTKTSWGYDDTVLFTFDTAAEELHEKDIITIYGESEGFYTYESILKQEITVPKLNVMYLDNHGPEQN